MTGGDLRRLPAVLPSLSRDPSRGAGVSPLRCAQGKLPPARGEGILHVIEPGGTRHSHNAFLDQEGTCQQSVQAGSEATCAD